ncbi:MAG: M28 family peptidase [Thermoanaerobaculia bacterium]
MQNWVALIVFGVLVPGLVAPDLRAQELIEALQVATAVAELGPRTSHRKVAHQSARAKLLEFMEAAGLEGVGQLPVSSPDVYNLTGHLPGSSGLEIILSAHYDTVKGSPGAVDNASGCGVVLAAVSELAQTPRNHDVRVILFDQEEFGAQGSRLWLDEIGSLRRRNVLANINVDMVGWSAGRPVILSFPTVHSGRLGQTPGWLVHAVIQGADATGTSLRMFDSRWPLMMQMVARLQRFRYAADSTAFLRWKIPSLTLSDSPLLDFYPHHHTSRDTLSHLDRARLNDWSRAVAATVRRLDGLQGRPTADDRYLVFVGRVWPRKYLYWAGFLIWIVLVFKGVPGRWVSTSLAERAQKSTRYLPGFVFRMLFLVSLFVAPALSTVLLYPAGVAYATVGGRGQRRKLAVVVGLAPITVLIGFLVLARLQVVTQGWPVPWRPVSLITLTLSAFYIALSRVSALADSSDISVADSSGNGPSRTAFEAGSAAVNADWLEDSTGPSSQPDASPRKL